MKTFTFRRILSQAALIIGTLVFAIGLQAYAQTYTAPTATPPTGNAQAPLDTGSSINYKTGELFVNMDSSGNNGPFINGLVVGGNVVVPNGNVQAPQFCLNGSCIGSWPNNPTPKPPSGTLCGLWSDVSPPSVGIPTGLTSVKCEGVDLGTQTCPSGYSLTHIIWFAEVNSSGNPSTSVILNSCVAN